jgi:hypothetical protein
MGDGFSEPQLSGRRVTALFFCPMHSEKSPLPHEGSTVGAHLLDGYCRELHAWLHATADILREARAFRFLAREHVAVDIVADVANSAKRFSEAMRDAGHRSECYDLEASAVLENFLRGHADLTADERKEIRRALALVHRSAEADHEISELAAVPV